MSTILTHLHVSFSKDFKARLYALLAAVAAFAPIMAPKDLADWIHQQVPWAPSWSSWVVSTGIILFRLWKASDAAQSQAPEQQS